MDLGSLAATSLPEVAKTLIEKVAEAANVLYEPTQIRRKARAEADAALIQATTELQISELQQRALMRLAAEEASNQQNMEGILDKAIGQLSDGASPEHLDNDWLRRFFDRGRLISDDEVQDIWARLLAGEADAPGTYSKRAIDILDSLDSKDVHAFTAVCSFVVDLRFPTPLIYAPSDSIFREHGLTMYALATLESVGLIHRSNGYERGGLDRSVEFMYFDEALYVEFTEHQRDEDVPEAYRMNLGTVVLSQAGMQLQRLVEPKAIEGFPEYVRSKWRELGYRTEPTE